MMDASEFTGGNYLAKSDVPDPVVVTVAKAEKNHFEGDSRAKLLLTFKEFDKPFVCNKTNVSLAVAALKTTDIGQWIGKRLVLYNDPTVPFGGQIVGGLRLRGLTPQEQQRIAEAEAGGEIKADPGAQAGESVQAQAAAIF